MLVERINVLGNNITDESVIRGELLLDEEIHLQLGLQKSVVKIKARNIFNEVKSEISNGTEKNLKVINIKVEETNGRDKCWSWNRYRWRNCGF